MDYSKLDQDELRALAQIALETAKAAAKTMQEEGILVESNRGGRVKNPAVSVWRDNAELYAKLTRLLAASGETDPNIEDELEVLLRGS